MPFFTKLGIEPSSVNLDAMFLARSKSIGSDNAVPAVVMAKANNKDFFIFTV